MLINYKKINQEENAVSKTDQKMKWLRQVTFY